MGLVTALAAGATAIGPAISAGKSNSAANKAADTATQTARENNALTREIYQENKGVLSPFVASGTGASALLNDFYGITPVATSAAPATPATGATGMGGYGMNREGFGGWMGQGSMGGVRPATTTAPTSAMPKADSRSAFANYIANSDYAFQQGEGNNQINSGYAGAGTVQSGAAMKALERFRQNLQSGYRQQWASGVANQQGVGLAAGSALAGVGQNYAGTIAASNTAASDARANAALSQQSPFANALGMAGAGILKAFG